MRFYVGITDYDWFTYLASLRPDEVNFWQPSGGRNFKSLQPGEPLLFKLHSPRNFIVGGGFFSHFTILPLNFAWETFGTKNGASSFLEMSARVTRYREGTSDGNAHVGCILLQQPFFFPPDQWIPVRDWPMSTVQGKGFDAASDGKEIWLQVESRLKTNPLQLDESVLVQEQKFGKPQVVLPRLGQGAFRVIVTENYKRQCAITSSHILHILDAAHIRPYSTNGGTHSPSNGILLRQDVHTLFDMGYVTVTPDYQVEVSSRLKAEFNNGEEYYKLQGKPLNLPELSQFLPNQKALEWHNNEVFKP